MTELAEIRTRTDQDLVNLGHALVRVHGNDGYPVEGVADPRSWLTPPGLIRSWVAELADVIVGHVSVSVPQGEEAVTLWSNDSGASADSIGVLARLFVLPESRGHSLGKRLTQTAMEYSTEVGRRLVLDVMTKDRAAIALYEHLGWRHIGDTHHVFDGSPGVPARCYVAPPATAED